MIPATVIKKFSKCPSMKCACLTAVTSVETLEKKVADVLYTVKNVCFSLRRD